MGLVVCLEFIVVVVVVLLEIPNERVSRGWLLFASVLQLIFFARAD